MALNLRAQKKIKHTRKALQPSVFTETYKPYCITGTVFFQTTKNAESLTCVAGRCRLGGRKWLQSLFVLRWVSQSSGGSAQAANTSAQRRHVQVWLKGENCPFRLAVTVLQHHGYHLWMCACLCVKVCSKWWKKYLPVTWISQWDCDISYLSFPSQHAVFTYVCHSCMNIIWLFLAKFIVIWSISQSMHEGEKVPSENCTRFFLFLLKEMVFFAQNTEDWK